MVNVGWTWFYQNINFLNLNPMFWGTLLSCSLETCPKHVLFNLGRRFSNFWLATNPNLAKEWLTLRQVINLLKLMDSSFSKFRRKLDQILFKSFTIWRKNLEKNFRKNFRQISNPQILKLLFPWLSTKKETKIWWNVVRFCNFYFEQKKEWFYLGVDFKNP